jgi:hypothetical protein
MVTSLELIEKLVSQLGAKYAMKELRDVEWFLGCRIVRDRVRVTKSLDRIKHEQFKQLFGIVDCSEAIATGMDKG